MTRGWTNSALAVVLILSGGSATQAQQTGETHRAHRVVEQDKTLEQAEAAIDRKEWEAAEAQLKQIVAADPKHFRAWFDLGTVYAATDRDPQAVEALRKSVAVQPDILESNLNLGLLLCQAGQVEGSKYLKAAEQLKPSSKQKELIVRGWRVLGAQLAGKGDFANSIDSLQQAIRLNPSDPSLHLELGRTYERAHDDVSAEREYKNMNAISPADPDAQLALAGLYLRTRRYSEAESNFRAIVKAVPQNEVARRDLGRALSANGNHEEAISEFEKALELKPTDIDAARELAHSQMALKRYGQAVPTLRLVASKTPNDAQVRYSLGYALAQIKNYADAQKELITAVKLKPDWPEAYGELALVASQNKDYALALKVLDTRSKVAAETPGTYFLRATSYDHLGAMKEASEQYKLFLSAANGKFPDEEWQAKHRLIAIDPETRKNAKSK